MTFKYKVIKLKTPMSEKTLGNVGKKGWKLVSIIEYMGIYLHYLLKEQYDDIQIVEEL